MKILVTGGAGYIGSITAWELIKKNHQVVIYDSLEKGHQTAVKGLNVVVGETQDTALLVKTIKNEDIKAVIHFAAYIEMGESYKNPGKYFTNNVSGSISLLRAMIETGINNLVFSSTAGVYGSPKKNPIKEDDPKQPENPYGESKLMVEKIMEWFSKAHKFNFASLRYFNACGASLDGKMGESHQPETHLIPNILKAVLENEKFIINGNDYQTQDGTCVRDYIHVLDLVSAHIAVLDQLTSEPKNYIYNVGTGKGYSIKEILKAVKTITGKEPEYSFGPRRQGDAAELVADPAKIKAELGWWPEHSNLETIIKTAWAWQQNKKY